jgi:hypothetical protein
MEKKLHTKELRFIELFQECLYKVVALKTVASDQFMNLNSPTNPFK